jgi:general secretion pathway protein B
MSFILDALRKSENERQQSAVPGISDVPTVVHDARVPKWVLGVIATLSAGILVLGWAWWQSSGESNVANVRPSGVLPPTQSVPPANTAGTVRNLAREPGAGTASAAQQTTAAPVVQPAPEPEIPTMVIGPPTMMEILAAGTVLPQMTLELHVFSSTAAQRFIRINSASYREGDVLSEGPRVVSITEEGVILNSRGQEFLLSAD